MLAPDVLLSSMFHLAERYSVWFRIKADASYIVRCGVTRTLHVMQSRQDYSRHARVIARTGRGLEVGEVLCEADDRSVAQLVEPPGGSIQREMTPDDERELAHISARLDEESDKCLEIVRELGLEMDLVEIERIFGGSAWWSTTWPKVESTFANW